MATESKIENLRSILLKGTGRSFFIKTIGTGIIFSAHIALTRMLGVHSYGIYIYAFALVHILAIFGKFGLDTSALRHIPRYVSTKEWGLAKGYFKYSERVHLLFSAVISIIAAIVIRFKTGASSNELLETLLLSCLLLPIIVNMQMLGAYLQSFKRVALAQAPELIIRPIIFVAGVFLFYKLNSNYVNAQFAVIFNIIASTSVLALMYYFYKNITPVQIKETSEEYRIKEWNKVSITFLMASGFIVLQQQVDIIMIGYYVNKTDSGIYAAASRLVQLISFGLIAINTIAAPVISQLYSLGEKSKLQKMMTLAAIGGLLYALPAGVVMIFFGKMLLGLFGPMFIYAYTALIILTVGRLLDSLTGLVEYFLKMTDHHIVVLKIQGFTVILNITLNIVLIPRYGMNGAAIATALSLITWNLLSLAYVIIKLRINPTIFTMATIKILKSQKRYNLTVSNR